MNLKDTIAAIATPIGRGGVGIVRVSGPRTISIAREILDEPPEPSHVAYRAFKTSDGQVIDAGLALMFRGPSSYTGEDVLELHGHGGRVVLSMLLKRVLELGARTARPGEFTLRAYLNEKIDLAQAEAVADLVDSQTETAARSAQRSLQGAFSQTVRNLLAVLIELRKCIEAAIDFPDEDLEILSSLKIREQVNFLSMELEKTRSLAKEGVLLKEGITMVIAGRPNVGKSSLLNRLTGEDIAIVTDIPGTTRDLLRAHISLDGLPIHIIDTAGLRDTQDEIEQQGIDRAWREARNADVIMLVIDNQVGITADDEKINSALGSHSRKIIVHNKIDLSNTAPSVTQVGSNREVRLSALTGHGLVQLRDHLKQMVGYGQTSEPVFIARQRHIEALTRAA